MLKTKCKNVAVGQYVNMISLSRRVEIVRVVCIVSMASEKLIAMNVVASQCANT